MIGNRSYGNGRASLQMKKQAIGSFALTKLPGECVRQAECDYQVKAGHCEQDSASTSAHDLNQILRWFQIFHPWGLINADTSEGKAA